ncbi:glycosyltransferase family 4 protein [Aquirufa nivalisilvae]|uniref:glycosyltransferase family 4 protein n=1 Tax=Aquirufa nivalisilvae TaxID=2516557 RepID=UPI001032B392|nr:glycosyltransferase family 4 protein [Aquirufa nivalisilvae]TBH76147.1 glycosyltransferase WbuB [Aquirufa nivalisilvae]
MKRIVYLTFYFEPDLCAGSFRNSPLAKVLAEKVKEDSVVEVYTTMPNRYDTYHAEASAYEERGNLIIHRIALPAHESGMMDQIKSFYTYFKEVIRLNKGQKADLIFASSSRLFTAFLGYVLSIKHKKPLYLDIRDIFVDTISDVIKSPIIKLFMLPVLKLIEYQTFSNAVHINLISGGFKTYFQQFKGVEFSEFTNGIDDEFLQVKPNPVSLRKEHNAVKTIVYAGNIGEGQGLHKIIPQAAVMLGEGYQFIIIGDGGAKGKLLSELQKRHVTNVELRKPIQRNLLIEEYQKADYLFLHLNDLDAFKKVLPSKIFELATFDSPMIAGVSGYAKEFIEKEITCSFVFSPCDVEAMVRGVKEFNEGKEIDRKEFFSKYNRDNINHAMAESIIQYL